MGILGSLGIHGAPVAAAAIVAVVAYMLHHHGWGGRFTSWLFAVAAVLFTIGCTLWLDALAGLTASGTGLTVLIAVLVIFGALAWKHTTDKKKHHPAWSTAIFMVAAVVIVVAIASFRAIMKNAGTSLKGSGKAFGQAIAQINSGQAAQAVPAHHRVSILLWGVGIFIAIVVILKALHGKGGKKKTPVTPSSGGARRPAITAGRGRR